MVISALFGVPLLVGAFLAFAASFILREPWHGYRMPDRVQTEVNRVMARHRKIIDAAEKKLGNANTQGAYERLRAVIDRETREMDIEVRTILESAKYATALEMSRGKVEGGLAVTNGIFRLIGLILVSLAFMLAPLGLLPFFKPLGLVIAIVAYFLIRSA